MSHRTCHDELRDRLGEAGLEPDGFRRARIALKELAHATNTAPGTRMPEAETLDREKGRVKAMNQTIHTRRARS